MICQSGDRVCIGFAQKTLYREDFLFLDHVEDLYIADLDIYEGRWYNVLLPYNLVDSKFPNPFIPKDKAESGYIYPANKNESKDTNPNKSGNTYRLGPHIIYTT